VAQTNGISHLQVYTHAELAEATENFSPAAVIGKGGFGKVYKGKLLRGMPVAIKKLDTDSMQGPNELYRELEILGTISHRHIVRLYGWCQEVPCLVFELCENGSLDTCLPKLHWDDRVRVATEVCRALIFLHTRKPAGVIHRDIKPSNVLLDHGWNAMLADVGVGKLLPTAEMTHVATSTLAGTFIYMDPDYLATGQVHSDDSSGMF